MEGELKMKKQSVEKKRGPNGVLPGFRVLQNECVWMRAGVVNFKICDHDYDCFQCDFDRGMRKALDAQKRATETTEEKSWAANMRKTYPGVDKPCRYLLTGQIDPPGRCNRDYVCDGCPIHMALEYHPVSRSIEAERYTQELRVHGRTSIASNGDSGKTPASPKPLNSECIWMQAGIINFKLCNDEYDCYHCEFDQTMRQVMGAAPGLGKSRSNQWHSFMNEHYKTQTVPCIHRLSGDTKAPAQCDKAQQCYGCAYHQEWMAAKQERLSDTPPDINEYTYTAGFKLAKDYYYHFGHTWVHIEDDGFVRVGVDDFASRVFGMARALQLPPKGVRLKQGETGWAFLRNGHKAAIQSPISGKVVSLNTRALEDPRLCHEDPYTGGWVMRMDPSSLKLDLQALYYGEECSRWMEAENQRLHQLLGPEYEQLASTGAQPVDDLFGNVPGLSWETLTETLLRTRNI